MVYVAMLCLVMIATLVYATAVLTPNSRIVHLDHGRTVECVRTTLGGVSCDWDHVKRDER